jgi:hypothetical protein
MVSAIILMSIERHKINQVAEALVNIRGVEINLYLYRLIRHYVVLYLHEIKPVCSEDWCHLQDRLPYVQTG